MAQKSKIEWTEASWNPLTKRCTKISPGCAHCYAERIVLRQGGDPFLPEYPPPKLDKEHLFDPVKWHKPKMIFVCSMSDLFHEDVSFGVIADIFAIMEESRHHTFQILTKRPDRMKRFLDGYYDPIDRCSVLPNVWLGVSVENQHWAEQRIPILLDTPAKLRFVSVEPMLEYTDIATWLLLLDWVIVGGESGPLNKVRPFHEAWALELHQQCLIAGIPFFMKQMGSAWAHEHGCADKKGGNPDEWPPSFRVREWPQNVSQSMTCLL